MEDVKTGPMESAAPAEQTSLPIADGGPLEMTGSLSEANVLANVGPPSPLTGCYLLIIIGEPHSEEARRVIIEQLKQGTSISCYEITDWVAQANSTFLLPKGKFRLRHFAFIPENKVTSATPERTRILLHCNQIFSNRSLW